MPADHLSLRGLIYSPITGVYARYVRVVTDAAGERFALVPAQICGKQNGGPYPARPPETTAAPKAQDAIFIIVLSAPRSRALLDVGSAPEIASGRGVGQWWLEGDASLIATVVPDGVSHVVFAFGPRHKPLKMTVRENFAVTRPSPAALPLGVTWYGRDGHVIRRFSISSPIPPA